VRTAIEGSTLSCPPPSPHPPHAVDRPSSQRKEKKKDRVCRPCRKCAAPPSRRRRRRRRRPPVPLPLRPSSSCGGLALALTWPPLQQPPPPGADSARRRPPGRGRASRLRTGRPARGRAAGGARSAAGQSTLLGGGVGSLEAASGRAGEEREREREDDDRGSGEGGKGVKGGGGGRGLAKSRSDERSGPEREGKEGGGRGTGGKASLAVAPRFACPSMSGREPGVRVRVGRGTTKRETTGSSYLVRLHHPQILPDEAVAVFERVDALGQGALVERPLDELELGQPDRFLAEVQLAVGLHR